jgi:hypothetical protein
MRMKNLFFAILLCLSYLPAYSQLNCNNVKASAHPIAGLYPNVKQIEYINQSSKMGGGKISETYTIDWGDNNTTTLSKWFNSVGHSYLNLGTYTIKMKLVVYDSVTMVTCVKSTSDVVVVQGPYCDRLKASIAVTVSNGIATLVNNCGPDEPGFSSGSYSYDWDDHAAGMTINKNPLTHAYTKAGTYKVKMTFTLSNRYKSCTDTTSATVTITVPFTGIQDPDVAALPFTVYPNPAKNTVNIIWAKMSDDVANIIITDISGKQIINSTAHMSSTATIDINNLHPGLYFITATTKDDRATLKLVVQ